MGRKISKTIGECVLPSGLKQTLSEFVSKGDLPNMILSGAPGVGKTTAIKAMLDQLGLTYMFINGSEESGIDVLRQRLRTLPLQFLYTVGENILF